MGAICVLIKYVAESGWCLLLVGPVPSRDHVRRAMSLGFVRLLIGREAMLAVSKLVVFPVGELFLYGVLLVGRWFAWGLLLYIQSRSAAARIPDPAPGSQGSGWRLGGILVSCLADIPALLTGIWVGVLWL